MNIYYIDYENVSSQGLKGVEALTENDEVNLLYSKKADNVKIDMLTMLMASKAKIRFLPVHVGTPNALDFQLVTLLFLRYKEGDHCYIISKDSGYDCCIKTAAENGAPNVARFPNIESALTGAPVKKTRRGRRGAKDVLQENENQAQQSAPKAQDLSDGQAPRSSEPAKGDENQPAPAALSDIAAVSAVPSASSPDNTAGSAAEAPDAEAVLQDTDHTGAADASSGTEGSAEEQPKKKSSRRRGRKKAVQADAENASSAQPQETSQQAAEHPDASQKVQKSGQRMIQPPKSRQNASQMQKNGQGASPIQKNGQGTSQIQKNGQGTPQIQKNGQSASPIQKNGQSASAIQKNGQNASAQSPKIDPDKPVSILSVIRRRNDVQLDLHQIDLIREALKTAGNKQQFYSFFVKNLGQKQGIELYHSIKSSYTDLMNAKLI